LTRFVARVLEGNPELDSLVRVLPSGIRFGRSGWQAVRCPLELLLHLDAANRRRAFRDSAVTPAFPSWSLLAEWARARLIRQAFRRAVGQAGDPEFPVSAVLARLLEVITGGEPLTPAAAPDALPLWERCQRELPALTLPDEIASRLGPTRRVSSGFWVEDHLVMTPLLLERRARVRPLHDALAEQLSGCAWDPLRELVRLPAIGVVTAGPHAPSLERRVLDRLRDGPVTGTVAPYEGVSLTLEGSGRVSAQVTLPEHLVETNVPHSGGGFCHVRWPSGRVGYDFELGGCTSLRGVPVIRDVGYLNHPTVRPEAGAGRVCIGSSAQVIADELSAGGMSDVGVRLAETLLTLRNAMVYGVLPGLRYHQPYESSLPRGHLRVYSPDEARQLAAERGIELVPWPR
jgi:hypothetical protein